MVIVAQLVRAPDCGSGGRGFEPRLSPFKKALSVMTGLFCSKASAVLAYLLSVNQGDWLNLSLSYEMYTTLEKSNVSLISFNVSLLLSLNLKS